MWDTMTLTKAASGVIGALLLLLLVNWAGQELYKVRATSETPGYVIEVAEEAGADEPELDFSEIMAAADPEAGVRVFRQCSACHALEDGQHGTGPSLYAVVNRAVEGTDFGGYSGALSAVAESWTPENLYAFLESPRRFAPGNAMSYSGLRKSEDRANLVAYLQTIGN